MIRAYNGNCLEVMDDLIAQGVRVDAVICDPPYGTISCGWDSVIPFPEMWERLDKITKPTAAVVLFGSEPFSTLLRASNIKDYKYDWYWVKNKVTGFVQCKNKPMKNIELISVFSKGTTGHVGKSKNRMTYNPQDLIEVNKTKKNGKGKFGTIAREWSGMQDTYTQEFTNYPKMVINFKSDTDLVHPTQKPAALLEYLVKTYTNPGETVLDFTDGSRTTGVACYNTGRDYIGIELDEGYYKAGNARIEALESNI